MGPMISPLLATRAAANRLLRRQRKQIITPQRPATSSASTVVVGYCDPCCPHGEPPIPNYTRFCACDEKKFWGHLTLGGLTDGPAHTCSDDGTCAGGGILGPAPLHWESTETFGLSPLNGTYAAPIDPLFPGGGTYPGAQVCVKFKVGNLDDITDLGIKIGECTTNYSDLGYADGVSCNDGPFDPSDPHWWTCCMCPNPFIIKQYVYQIACCLTCKNDDCETGKWWYEVGGVYAKSVLYLNWVSPFQSHDGPDTWVCVPDYVVGGGDLTLLRPNLQLNTTCRDVMCGFTGRGIDTDGELFSSSMGPSCCTWGPTAFNVGGTAEMWLT